MRKYFLTSLTAVFALALAGPALAQDNVSGLGAQESTDGLVFKSLQANNNYFATKYQCKDATLTSSTISAAIADCCIPGDIWRATIWKGNSNNTFENTANTSQFVAGAPAFAPDTFSPDALIGGKISGVYVLATMGNQTPGGLPAGGTLRISTNGATPACVRKQVKNGVAGS